MDATRVEDLLQQKRRDLEQQREHLRESGLDQGAKDSIQELSTYDNHPADIGTETWERSKDLALQGNIDRQLDQIDRALNRLASGDYGVCERCGRPIESSRLEAAPEVTLCMSCAGEAERERRTDPQKRPVEEQLLSPPFARTFTDDRDNNAYDGEDAWQEVARYGSSDTPSDVPGSRGYPDVYEDADEDHGAVEPYENQVDEKGEPLDKDDKRVE